MKAYSLALLILMSGSLFTPAQAHHSFRGVYDFSNVVAIEGAVVKFELNNPHARLFIDVVGENGATEQWVVEAPGKLSLARRGWTEDMFATGERITAVGNLSSTGKKALWLEKIIREDGSELVDPLVEDDLAIEEERRERARRAVE